MTTDYSSLVEAHHDLLKKGYDKNYKVVNQELLHDESGKEYEPCELTIDEFHRFEGESDPADNTIIYAVSANDGTKGTLVDAYGSQGSRKVAQFVLKVEDTTQNMLSNRLALLRSQIVKKAKQEEKLLIGLAAGALVGVAVGLLLAPKGRKLNKLAKEAKRAVPSFKQVAKRLRSV